MEWEQYLSVENKGNTICDITNKVQDTGGHYTVYNIHCPNEIYRNKFNFIKKRIFRIFAKVFQAHQIQYREFALLPNTVITITITVAANFEFCWIRNMRCYFVPLLFFPNHIVGKISIFSPTLVAQLLTIAVCGQNRMLEKYRIRICVLEKNLFVFPVWSNRWCNMCFNLRNWLLHLVGCCFCLLVLCFIFCVWYLWQQVPDRKIFTGWCPGPNWRF